VSAHAIISSPESLLAVRDIKSKDCTLLASLKTPTHDAGFIRGEHLIDVTPCEGSEEPPPPTTHVPLPASTVVEWH